MQVLQHLLCCRKQFFITFVHEIQWKSSCSVVCFVGLHFSKSKIFGTNFNIMAALTRHNLPLGPQIIHSRMGLLRERKGGEVATGTAFCRIYPSFWHKTHAKCRKKPCFLHGKAELSAAKCRAFCMKKPC